MKKFLATILAFIYLSTSIGATVHLHYCMGRLVSWGLLHHESKNCMTCGMPKKVDNKQHYITASKGCCKDEQKEIKTDKDQKIVQSELQLLKPFTDALAVIHMGQLNLYVSSLTIEYPTANAPPEIGKPPVFLLNRNFRI